MKRWKIHHCKSSGFKTSKNRIELVMGFLKRIPIHIILCVCVCQFCVYGANVHIIKNCCIHILFIATSKHLPLSYHFYLSASITHAILPFCTHRWMRWRINRHGANTSKHSNSNNNSRKKTHRAIRWNLLINETIQFQFGCKVHTHIHTVRNDTQKSGKRNAWEQNSNNNNKNTYSGHSASKPILRNGKHDKWLPN